MWNKIFAIGLLLIFWNCTSKDDGRFHVVATTTMIKDLVEQIGKDSVEVVGLMGAGVDPHTYKASENDILKLGNADIIFYNGLHLEGKLVEVLEKIGEHKHNTMALAAKIPEEQLINSGNFVGNHDPHMWFSVQIWKKCAQEVEEELSQLKPDAQPYFQQNLAKYERKLDSLNISIQKKINTLPSKKRILVTAHDAFSYFGRDYGFKVVGLQGLSTSTEAGTKDMLQLANFIVENDIPAIFVESSVPERTMKALQRAVENRGKSVALGGTLFSDALGSPTDPTGNFIGMYQYNVNTIVNALNQTNE